MARSTHKIIVSNRLPFSFDKATKTLTPSAGGLVSALRGGKLDERYIWVGAAPDHLTPKLWEKLKKTIQSKMQFVPIFVDPLLYEDYYAGFSNSVVWPLLHYDAELIKFKPKLWKAYHRVNEQFMQTILSIAKTNDLVWVHDYHLMLLPQLLKQKRPHLKVGFFLHIPFPETTIFQKLPMHKEVLSGLLAADLIGFHLYQYLQNFCSAVKNILGLSSDSLTVVNNHHTTYLEAFPISIDTARFIQQARSAAVKKLTHAYAHREFTFLSIERMDYIKGFDLKLQAYRQLLKTCPECIGKVLLFQLAIPTRENVLAYRRLKTQVEEMIHAINNEFKTSSWRPIHYMYDSIQFNELLALYRSSDALIVNSKHDGMNLVVFEYIASQNPKDPGVVILSEFAGATSMLSEAISINPWNAEETAKTMNAVIHMKKEERIERHHTMLTYLKKYTATKWAKSFIRRLDEIKPQVGHIPELITVTKLCEQIQQKFSVTAKQPLNLLLDYDGTLTPIVKHPELAKLPKKTYALLQQLIEKKQIKIIIVSGRTADFLSRQLKSLNCNIVAEHGAMYFDRKKNTWETLVNFNPKDWFATIKKMMQSFTDRVPESFIEQKKFSLAWHYRQSPAKFASQQAIILKDTLETAFSNAPITIQQGKKVIEVKTVEANKGFFVRWYSKNHKNSKYLLTLGDDTTDEDLFEATQSLNGLAIRVGTGISCANYRLRKQQEVITFLKKLNERYT
jgi:trehalose 6-phosphate synthase/phosphatase